ncbi:DUF3168 domain-containing protein [Salinarimonas sp.]|uniref:DUF3168 domain-containing protein n=1 Tax=Salinarimonas sp. TaxID=2766526 RepID=UPI0039190FD6
MSGSGPMIAGPILALRNAILSALAGDSALAGLFGGEVRLSDEPPRGSPPVYAVFGRVIAREASGTEVRGHEQRAEIAVHAKPGSAATALAIVDRMAALLDDSAPAVPGHRLVSLSVAETGCVRDASSGAARAWLVLRAVTEIIET